jgi:hypothetical protein
MAFGPTVWWQGMVCLHYHNFAIIAGFQAYGKP